MRDRKPPNILHKRDKRRRTDIIRKQSSHFGAHQSRMPLGRCSLSSRRQIITMTTERLSLPPPRKSHRSTRGTPPSWMPRFDATTKTPRKMSFSVISVSTDDGKRPPCCSFILGLDDVVKSTVEVSRCFPRRCEMRALPTKHCGVLQQIVDRAQWHPDPGTCLSC